MPVNNVYTDFKKEIQKDFKGLTCCISGINYIAYCMTDDENNGVYNGNASDALGQLAEKLKTHCNGIKEMLYDLQLMK